MYINKPNQWNQQGASWGTRTKDRTLFLFLSKLPLYSLFFLLIIFFCFPMHMVEDAFSLGAPEFIGSVQVTSPDWWLSLKSSSKFPGERVWVTKPGGLFLVQSTVASWWLPTCDWAGKCGGGGALNFLESFCKFGMWVIMHRTCLLQCWWVLQETMFAEYFAHFQHIESTEYNIYIIAILSLSS